MLSPINARKLVPTQGTYARYLQPRRNRPPRDLSKRNRNRLVESQKPQAKITLFSLADQKLISDAATALWSDLKGIEVLP